MSTAPRRRLDVLGRHLTASSASSDGSAAVSSDDSAAAAGASSSSTSDSSEVRVVATSTEEVLAARQSRWHGVDPLKVDINVTGENLPPVVRGKILHFMDQITDTRRDANGWDVADHLPGPLRDVGPGKRYPDLKALLLELQRAGNQGFNHILWTAYQDRYAGGVRTANFVQPVVSFTRRNTRPPIIANQVVVSHPQDAMRIAKAHVQKMPDQTVFLGSGVLSQLDNKRWKEQRAHLSEAFMPYSSLQYLLPVSERRARKANSLLRAAAESQQGNVVELNEFLLNETMAQLMLAMFGIPEDVVEQQNKKIRNAFAYLLQATGGTGSGAAEDIDPEELQKYSMHVFEFVSAFFNVADDTKGVYEVSVSSPVPRLLCLPVSAISPSPSAPFCLCLCLYLATFASRHFRCIVVAKTCLNISPHRPPRGAFSLALPKRFFRTLKCRFNACPRTPGPTQSWGRWAHGSLTSRQTTTSACSTPPRSYLQATTRRPTPCHG